MTTMLERVARAIRDEDGAYQHSDGAWITEGGIVGDDHWIDIARAAIMAMREPTDAMREPFTESLHWDDLDQDDVWAEMIDAALSGDNEPLAEGEK